MKIYSKQNVFDAALERINYLFDEFPNVVVGFSGGKDSTICLNLCLRVARERNRLPQKVMFIDQEAEWGIVIDYVRRVMSREDVKPYWFQMPIQIFNGASHAKPWCYCWADEEEKNWIREKEPNSIHKNTYGTMRFGELFTKIFEKEFPKEKSCYIAGVRAEESSTRYVALTSTKTYKHITYGKILNRNLGHYTFYPLYDWTYRDVWKAVHENSWDYCEIYDLMYQHGVSVKDMRVSNLHHETALRSLTYLQEIEGKTWNRILNRVSGANSIKHLSADALLPPKELPYMFESWIEYRDYLVQNLLQDDNAKGLFSKKFHSMDAQYGDAPPVIHEQMVKTQIAALMVNDYYFTKITNFERRPIVHSWRVAKRNNKLEDWHAD